MENENVEKKAVVEETEQAVGKGIPGHVQGCMCEGCLILVVQPDAPTCKGCGRVVDVVDAEGFCGPCVGPAKVKRVRKPRAKTHGKNGVAPLAAIPPDEAIPDAIPEEGALPVEELGHADTAPAFSARSVCPVCGDFEPCEKSHIERATIPDLELDKRGGGNVGWTDGQGIPEEAEQPNDKAPPSPRRCARMGCGALALENEMWCSGHGIAAAMAECADLTVRQPRKGVPADVLREALEAAWVALSEDSTLEPVTVAVCKRLRDLERGL